MKTIQNYKRNYIIDQQNQIKGNLKKKQKSFTKTQKSCQR